MAVEPFCDVLFAGHGVHLSSPENASANVLAGHLLHDTAPAMLDPPAAHDMQSVALLDPTDVEYVPAAQGVHTVLLELAGDVEYLPAEHAVQALALALAQVPTLHVTHVVVPVGAYDPASHAVHSVWPPVLNRPAGQSEHPHELELATLEVPYFPAWQPVHALELYEAEYVPGTHAWHANGQAERFARYPGLHTQLPRPPPPGESENAGQPMQLEELSTLYVLGWHCTHDVAPSREYVPAGHHVQLSWLLAPDALELVPAGQALQALLELAPTAALYVPPGQDVQDENRWLDQYPAWQGLHPDALGGEYWPAEQLVQRDAPCPE